jgi:hypothetical protein
MSHNETHSRSIRVEGICVSKIVRLRIVSNISLELSKANLNLKLESSRVTMGSPYMVRRVYLTWLLSAAAWSQ